MYKMIDFNLMHLAFQIHPTLFTNNYSVDLYLDNVILF